MIRARRQNTVRVLVWGGWGVVGVDWGGVLAGSVGEWVGWGPTCTSTCTCKPSVSDGSVSRDVSTSEEPTFPSGRRTRPSHTRERQAAMFSVVKSATGKEAGATPQQQLGANEFPEESAAPQRLSTMHKTVDTTSHELLSELLTTSYNATVQEEMTRTFTTLSAKAKEAGSTLYTQDAAIARSMLRARDNWWKLKFESKNVAMAARLRKQEADLKQSHEGQLQAHLQRLREELLATNPESAVAFAISYAVQSGAQTYPTASAYRNLKGRHARLPRSQEAAGEPGRGQPAAQISNGRRGQASKHPRLVRDRRPLTVPLR